AHRARQRHEHHAALVYVFDVGVGRVFERRGVEVEKMTVDEVGNRTIRGWHWAKTITCLRPAKAGRYARKPDATLESRTLRSKAGRYGGTVNARSSPGISVWPAAART